MKAQTRHSEINLQGQKNNAERDILESTDMINLELDNKKADKKLGTKLIKCKVCEMKFAKFCDLEWHLKAKHEECTQFECDQCKKTFVTEWRMKKHSKIHSNKITKQCHFFRNNIRCPFDELGCKFLHTLSYDSNPKSADDSENEKFGDTMENGIENDIVVDIEDMMYPIDFCETSKEITFTASTPKKKIRRCENCLDEWECIECLVINTLTKHGDIKKIFI